MNILGILLQIWLKAPWKEALASTLYAVGMILSIPFNRAPKELAKKRLELGCHRCDMFHHVYKSCGTPGRMSHGRPSGCWCYMPLAVHHLKKRCWKAVNGYEDQWTFKT